MGIVYRYCVALGGYQYISDRNMGYVWTYIRCSLSDADIIQFEKDKQPRKRVLVLDVSMLVLVED